MKVQAIEQCKQTEVQMDGAVGVKMRMLIGPDDGAKNFHMRHFEVDAGGHTPFHQHDFEHEVLILSGRGTLKQERADQSLAAGQVVFIPPNEKHQFANPGSEPLSFICSIPAPRDCSS